MSLTYTQQVTLPDGRPCTLTWSVSYRKLDASEGGGLGCEELELEALLVPGQFGELRAEGENALAVAEGYGVNWYNNCYEEASNDLDDETLQRLVNDDYGGPDDED